MFILKEKILSQVLTVENLSKNHFDLSLIKILFFNKSTLSKFDYLYGTILQENDKIKNLRDYSYFSSARIWEYITNLSSYDELLNYFMNE